MTKSMNPHERHMQVRTLEDNIEAGKYQTEKDKAMDQLREQEEQ